MPLIPYHNPFWDLENFFEEDHLTVRSPRMDIYETEREVIAEVELPGIDPKDTNVEVQENTLKVEAKGKEKKEEKKKGYYRKEMSGQYYKRVVPLPVEVIGKKAKASYKDGILKISIPKARPKKEKKGGFKVKIDSE